MDTNNSRGNRLHRVRARIWPTRLGTIATLALCLPWAACLADIPLQFPPQPASLYAKVQGQEIQVVAYKDQVPLVMLNGRLSPVPDAQLSFRPSEEFAPGFVRIENPILTAQTTKHTFSGTERYSILEAKLTADRELDNVFVVVLVYNDWRSEFLTPPPARIWGKQVGRMEAGQRKSIAEFFPENKTFHKVQWDLLVYSNGKIVQTSMGTSTLSLLFDTMARDAWQDAYLLLRKSDAAARVFHPLPYIFSEAVRRRHEGQTLIARVHLDNEGNVLRIDLPDLNDDEFAREARSQLRCWLYLPASTLGKTLSSTVEVPIRFPDQTSGSAIPTAPAPKN
jgi:hypothetical protein